MSTLKTKVFHDGSFQCNWNIQNEENTMKVCQFTGRKVSSQINVPFVKGKVFSAYNSAKGQVMSYGYNVGNPNYRDPVPFVDPEKMDEIGQFRSLSESEKQKIDGVIVSNDPLKEKAWIVFYEK